MKVKEDPDDCPFHGECSCAVFTGRHEAAMACYKEMDKVIDLRAAMEAIKAQCAGHADEFSQRVWKLAEEALHGGH